MARLLGRDLGETRLEVQIEHDEAIVVQRTRAPERLVWEIKRQGMDCRSDCTFEAIPEGTRVAFTWDVSLNGLKSLKGPIMKGSLRKLLKNGILMPLKRAAETHVTKGE